MDFMSVDCHFHIFDKDVINPAIARYAVSNSASLSEWLSLANAEGITHGVIVQPSFLGTDNTLLIDAIAKYPDRLKGIAVVDPAITKNELQALQNKGIRGVRLNLSEDPKPLETIARNQALMGHLKDLNMHLQIHHDDGLLNTLLLHVPLGLQIVIDHFGRPKTNTEFLSQSSGIDRHQQNLWVKLSAPYRTPHLNHRAIYQYWLNKIGSARLVWGSDWPHTRHEHKQNYANQVGQLQALSDDEDLKSGILKTNPLALYWP